MFIAEKIKIRRKEIKITELRCKGYRFPLFKDKSFAVLLYMVTESLYIQNIIGCVYYTQAFPGGWEDPLGKDLATNSGILA